MNKSILIGNLTNEPELKKTNDNKSICRFSLAVNESKDVCDFINCVAWEKNADNIVRYLHKGSKLAVEGRIKNNNWTDNNGQKHYDIYLRVDRMEFVSKPTDNSSSNQTQAYKPTTEPWEKDEQLNITGTNRDVLGFPEDQKNGYVDIKTNDLPFY